MTSKSAVNAMPHTIVHYTVARTYQLIPGAHNSMRHPLLASLAVALVPALYTCPAASAPIFSPGFNQLFLDDFDNAYRTSANCVTVGGCLTFDATNDPTGWQRVDPTVMGNNHVGDVLAGIFSVARIENPSGNSIWLRVPGMDEFTGYFAQQLIAIQPAISDPSGKDHLTYAAAPVDPFGILNAGDIFRFYVNEGVSVSSFRFSGPVFQDIGVAADGVFWASLGMGGSGGYDYIHLNNPSRGFFALDLLALGPNYNAGILAPVNDPGENEIGGTTLLNQIIGSRSIVLNPAFPSTSPWTLTNEASFSLYRVPEPGILALLGLGFLGLAGMRRKEYDHSPLFSACAGKRAN